MNDFTKEELIKIENALGDIPSEFNSFLYGRYIYLKEFKEIIQKIGYMINNYCEHEFYLNGCGKQMFGECHKCGKLNKLIELA